MRVSFFTLGCKLNFAETSTIRRDFESRSFVVVPFGEPADVTVINTCTVTEEADRKCRQTIRRALRANPDAFIAVTGCYAQLRPRQIAAIDGVDAVLGASEKFRLFDLVSSFDKKEETQINVSCIDEVRDYGPAVSSVERTRAFLKVQDGCDYSCSFCTIPMARGPSRSHSIAGAVEQARELADSGFREVVLSGVNIGLFGIESNQNLLQLLRELDGVDGIARYRISSIEPNLLTDEIISFVSESRAFVPHFHVPLQSGDDVVLGKMRRRYRRSLYADRVDKIKSLMPQACIGADVIVGFPAENDARFENTVSFLRALPIAYLHVFTYSERAGTAAIDLVNDSYEPIPKQTRSSRNRRLTILSEKKRRAFYLKNAGRTSRVLWEEKNRAGFMHGFTDNYIRVRREYDASASGTLQWVTLGDLCADGIFETEIGVRA